jgi:hypothetical protein
MPPDTQTPGRPDDTIAAEAIAARLGHRSMRMTMVYATLENCIR